LVIDVDQSICRPPPIDAGSAENKIVSKVVKLKDELLMLIDREIFLNNVTLNAKGK